MTHVTKDKLNHEQRLIWEAGEQQGQRCFNHDNRPKIFCSKCADTIKDNCRAEALEEVEKIIKGYEFGSYADSENILRDIEALKKRGEKK